MKFLIVKNITREGPGLLEELLDSYNFGYDIVDLDKGESFPDPSDYSAVIVMGGPDSANDTTPKMREELKRIKEAIRKLKGRVAFTEKIELREHIIVATVKRDHSSI